MLAGCRNRNIQECDGRIARCGARRFRGYLCHVEWVTVLRGFFRKPENESHCFMASEWPFRGYSIAVEGKFTYPCLPTLAPKPYTNSLLLQPSCKHFSWQDIEDTAVAKRHGAR